ncbi:MAG: hypothetical protein AAB849_01975 [Patescibacteria group bacterium]
MMSIEKLASNNFLSVCDVAMDIMEKLQISDDAKVRFRLMPNRIRFKVLMPFDAINIRDEYCEYRAQALKYLKINQYILEYSFISDSNRWDTEVEASINREQFEKFYHQLEGVYQKRVVDPQINENNQKKEPNKIKFHFCEGVLFRDGIDGILQFSEKTLEYNLLVVSLSLPLNDRIDVATQGVDCEKWKQLYDVAMRLNEKISLKFGINNFFEIDYKNMHLKRITE